MGSDVQALEIGTDPRITQDAKKVTRYHWQKALIITRHQFGVWEGSLLATTPLISQNL